MRDDEAMSKDQIDKSSLYVVDGGTLLQRVRWMKSLTFKELAQLYVSYVRRHYGVAFIVLMDISNLQQSHMNICAEQDMEKSVTV